MEKRNEKSPASEEGAAMSRPIRNILQARVAGVLVAGPAVSAEPNPPRGVEVLARGPIHEAFAQPTSDQPESPPPTTEPPPEPVPEQPPEQKPEGDNVQWVPGYWQWDDTRGDFVWIS